MLQGPEHFINVTNGISPRRWLHQANPGLATLITDTLKTKEWVKNLDLLRQLEEFVLNKDFCAQWARVKLDNKVRLAEYVRKTLQVEINPQALFDIQVKRIHEYKRQFMNILSVIYRYQQLKRSAQYYLQEGVPKVVIFGGKAAPGYYIAKLVIKLITSVAKVVNQDSSTNHLLQVLFLPDYNVSLAEIIIPASDISQHISTAGTEASGTSNMKFVLNGGLILGTVDGANVEIAEQVGPENIFTFGCEAHEVEEHRHARRFQMPTPAPLLKPVLESIQKGDFGDPHVFAPLLETITSGGDMYLVNVDFASYIEAQAAVEAAFRDQASWVQKSILCTARVGKFSSDNSIREYARRVWDLQPCPLPTES